MGVLDQGKVDRIKQLLRSYPKGMTISDLSSKTRTNRNMMAKYLDLLLISGQVEMNTVGSAKVYHLSHLVPISAMLEFSSDLVIMFDDQRKILQVNEPVLAAVKEEKKAILGKAIEEIDNALFKSLIKVKPGSKTETEEITCSLNGEECIYRIKQVPTAFEDGTRGITLIMEDVTAQRKYNEMLEKREARYREIVEDQPDLICRFLPDFALTFANPAYIRHYALDPGTLPGRNYLSFFRTDDAEAVKHQIASLRVDNPMSRCQVRTEGDSAPAGWQEWTYLARFGESGEVVEVQGTGRDITGEKKREEEKERQFARMHSLSREKSEKQVKACEQQYRTLIQYLDMGMYRSTADPKGEFLWGNTSFINILGYESMTELQGINVIEIFAYPEARKEILEELRLHGFVKNKIIHLKRRDQAQVTVSVTAVAELNEQGEITAINGVVQDITGLPDRSPETPAAGSPGDT